MSRISGIYCIRNTKNNKVYIGKAVDLNRRKSQHFSNLKKNIHKNFKLQGSYNKHGHNVFKFEILETCNENQIDIKEMDYIDKYNSCKYGYNISNQIQHHSKEWISKLKDLRKNDPKFIEQFNNCRSKVDNRVKINEYDLQGNYIKTWDSIIEASKFYNYKCNSLITSVLTFKRSKAANRLFRYFKGETNKIEPFKSFRKTKLKFTNMNEELIFESGIEASNYFNTSKSNISLSLKKGYYKNYNIIKI